MIKKYEKFIFESYSRRVNEIEKEIDHLISLSIIRNDLKKIERVFDYILSKFAISLKSLSEFYSEFYSNMAATPKLDPEEDYHVIQKLMDKAGFSVVNIKRIFSIQICRCIYGHERIGEIFMKWIKNSKIGEISGYIDFYLYKINEILSFDQKIMLGGEFDMDLIDNNEELVIKYSYGYHKTKYGQLFLLQRGINPKDFPKINAEIKQESLSKISIEDWDDIIFNNIRHMMAYKFGLRVDFTKKQCEKYYYVDDDRIIIEYGEIYSDLKSNKKAMDLSKSAEKPTITEENIKSNILSFPFESPIYGNSGLPTNGCSYFKIKDDLNFIDNGKEIIVKYDKLSDKWKEEQI